MTPRLESYKAQSCVWEGYSAEISPLRGRNPGLYYSKGVILPLLSGGVRLGAGAILLVVGLDDGRQRGDGLALAEADDDHALGGAAEPLDLLDGHADDRAAG